MGKGVKNLILLGRKIDQFDTILLTKKMNRRSINNKNFKKG